MKKLKVYIASPYTKDWMPNAVRRQLEAKNILIDRGFTPFAPLENHFNEIHHHREEHEWFAWDLEWLEVCNILVRIHPVYDNGEEIPSIGSEKEEEHAKKCGIPVFHFDTVQDLNEWAWTTDKEDLWNLCRKEKTQIYLEQ